MIPAPHEFPPGQAVVDHLRKWAEFEDTKADEMAQSGGEERATAAEHMRRAERFDELAVSARTRADRWRRHIVFEQSSDMPHAVRLVGPQLEDTALMDAVQDEAAS